jgi:two-component system cell cycle response regulator DivK
MAVPARILVVEDNEVNLMVFTDILSAAGYQVLAAKTAEECFAVAAKESPDLILMDIQLPGMDGLEAREGAQGEPHDERDPGRRPHRPRHALASGTGHRSGMLGFITKPIRSRNFREEVQGHLEGKKA